MTGAGLKAPVPADFQISALSAADVEPLCALAREIWLQHYPGIITVRQIEYMLAQRYSADSILRQLQTAQAWWDKLEVKGELCGFASYERADEAQVMKLDKLYVHQLVRAKGYGSALIDHVSRVAAREGMCRLTLQVNKYNHGSVEAYRRAGFTVTRQIRADIGNGFFMDDFIMSRQIASS